MAVEGTKTYCPLDDPCEKCESVWHLRKFYVKLYNLYPSTIEFSDGYLSLYVTGRHGECFFHGTFTDFVLCALLG